MLTPRPYQIEGRDFLAGRKCALLADEMRVGKTPQAILAAHKRGATSIRVGCPAIAVPHWHREVEKWWPSGPLPRLEVMSYNKLTELWTQGIKGTADVFIPDEAHFAKNPDALRTRAVYSNTGFCRYAGATWPLSGTPAPKHAGELWPMMRAFGATKMDYQWFVGKYCTINKFTQKITGTKEKMIPELRALLATFMLRRTRKEVAPEMPDIDFQFLEVEPNGQADIQVPAGLSDEQLAEWLESNQCADASDRVAVAHAKVLPLAKHIDFAIQNDLLQQTVVFGWHTEPLEHLTRLLNDCGISAELITGKTGPRSRERIQDNLQKGLTDVICGNIMAMGTAIDLSSARHGFALELDWVPGNNVQAVNRLVSMEKEDKVTVDVVTWPGSTDDRVQQVLMRRVRELNQLY